MASFQLSAAQGPYPKLDELYTGKQFFDLRDALQGYGGYGRDRSPEILFYQAVVAAAFNQPQLAIGHIQNFLKQRNAGRDRARTVDSYAILADSYLKTYQYRGAAEAYSEILTSLRDQIDDERVPDYKNSSRLWNALRDVPPQTVRFDGDSTATQ